MEVKDRSSFSDLFQAQAELSRKSLAAQLLAAHSCGSLVDRARRREEAVALSCRRRAPPSDLIKRGRR